MAQNVKQQLPPQALEKEFVYNLQQQVYFLELQGKLLREKMTETKQQKSRGVEANPLFDCQLDESLPLTQLFDRLKMQFSVQTAENKKQIDALKKEIDEKNLLCTEQKIKIDDLQEYKANFQQIMQKSEEKLKAIVNNQQIECENYKQEISKHEINSNLLQDQVNDYQIINKEQTAQIYSLNALTKQLQNELHQQKTNVLASEQLQNQLSKLQFEHQTLQNQNQQTNNELIAFRSQYQQLENETFQLRQQNESLKMEVKNLNSQVQMLNNELQTQTKSLSQQRSLLEQSNNEKKMLKQNLEQSMQFNNDIQEIIKAFNDKRKMDQLNQIIDQLKIDLTEQINNNKVLSANMKQQDIKINALNNQISKLNDKIACDQSNLTQKTGGFNAVVLLNQSQQADILQQSEQIKELLDEKDRLEAKIEFLESELDMKQEMSHLQLEEFENLRKSNTQLADMLNNLQSKFTNLGRAGEKYVRSEKKEIADEKQVARAAYNDRVGIK
ncbi:Conserved_hypothetical protein [Hexamita inflata]|uniref:Uncharacterized protein n=1 Tax=Hexamita inflata TaxID=28002 RepID=A0AA86NN49_9EUKA|nr:Conserved hypothetical protein [Hexamita inflata]